VGHNWEHYGWSELFVPFTKLEYSNTAAITCGVFAFYLMVVIQLTSWIMKWLPRKLWHATHLLSYVLFRMATIHGFKAGTEEAPRPATDRILQGRAKRTRRAAAN